MEQPKEYAPNGCLKGYCQHNVPLVDECNDCHQLVIADQAWREYHEAHADQFPSYKDRLEMIYGGHYAVPTP